MRRIVLLAVVAVLCVAFVPMEQADAAEGLSGHAQNDAVSISYTEPLAYISFTSMPSGAFNISVFSTGHIQPSIYIPEPKKALVIELEPLLEQTYTFLITYADGSELTTLDMAIGHYTLCKVTLAPGDGKGSAITETIVSGGDFILPDCTFGAPNGKQFSSWSVSGKTCQPGDTITVSSDVTVTAMWEDAPSDGGISPMIIVIIVGAIVIALLAVVFLLRRKP